MAKEATPYQLVALLMQKLLDNVATAKGAITQKNYEKKGMELSNALQKLHKNPMCRFS